MGMMLLISHPPSNVIQSLKAHPHLVAMFPAPQRRGIPKACDE
jgi:hypothetical protein